MIYIADEDWRPSGPNPFHADEAYGADWSAFVYDPSIPYFTNVSPHAQLHTLRFSPQADKDRLRLFDFFSYEESYRRNVIFQPCRAWTRSRCFCGTHLCPVGLSSEGRMNRIWCTVPQKRILKTSKGRGRFYPQTA